MKTIYFLFLSLLIPFLLSGCFRTRADIAREKEEQEVREALQKNTVEYQQNMERMQAELGRLQGKLEELEHQRKKEMSTYSSTSEGTEKSVSEVKARMEEMQKTQGALFEEIKRLKEENLQLIKTMQKPAPAPATAGKKKNATSGFEEALTAYKAKDYAAAKSGFRSYLQALPNGKRSIDARYFLGESLYRTKAYDEAIVEFSVIHEKSPKSTLGRKSTLRIAESFQAMGKPKDAKAFAQILVQTSPDTVEAKKARKFLQ